MLRDPLLDGLERLHERWQVRARVIRERSGEPAQAVHVERVIEELQGLLRRERGRLLTVTEAAALARRCPSSIRKYLASGRLPNCGRPYVPRIRLEDLRALFPGA